jgi:hypothetical protein
MRQEQKFTLVKPMRRILIVLLSVHACTHTWTHTALDLDFAQRLLVCRSRNTRRFNNFRITVVRIVHI